MARGSNLIVIRRGAHLGAEVTGVDFSKSQSKTNHKVIIDALMEHEVLVFPEIEITVEEQAAFGEQFGELSVHPFSPHDVDKPELIVLDNDGDRPPLATDIWHSDETFREVPPMGTILRARLVPEVGGDTVFASMTAAFEGLSDRWQCFLTGLEAVHDFKPFWRLFSGDAASRKNCRPWKCSFPTRCIRLSDCTRLLARRRFS
ncbi:MAG: TauD/TfdA family dioxygenase [Pseudomonadota bacterium]|nr:TauD/TfdA family dioxygenase [Pseudomonadota bacterium]